MNSLVFWDVVKKKYEKDGNARLFFPTLCRCSYCQGYKGFMWKGDMEYDEELTMQLALAQFGYQVAPNYGNDPPGLREYCDCKERRTHFARMVKKYMILDWGKWEECGGYPQHGITDFERIVEVGRKFTPTELDIVCEYLKRSNDCPGWTGVAGIKIKDPGTYKFTTTWDSSG